MYMRLCTCSAYFMLLSTYRVLVPEVLVLQLGRFLSRQAVVPAAEHHVTAAVVAVTAVHQTIANAAARAVNTRTQQHAVTSSRGEQ